MYKISLFPGEFILLENRMLWVLQLLILQCIWLSRWGELPRSIFY